MLRQCRRQLWLLQLLGQRDDPRRQRRQIAEQRRTTTAGKVGQRLGEEGGVSAVRAGELRGESGQYCGTSLLIADSCGSDEGRGQQRRYTGGEGGKGLGAVPLISDGCGRR